MYEIFLVEFFNSLEDLTQRKTTTANASIGKAVDKPLSLSVADTRDVNRKSQAVDMPLWLLSTVISRSRVSQAVDGPLWPLTALKF